jgi:hypothetical protein
MDSLVVTVTHAHPLQTEVFGMLDYNALRVAPAANGWLGLVQQDIGPAALP